jgi:hypothetical protein
LEEEGNARWADHLKFLHKVREDARLNEEKYKAAMVQRHSKPGKFFEPVVGMAVKVKTNLKKKDTDQYLLPYVFGRVARLSTGKQSCDVMCAWGKIKGIPVKFIAEMPDDFTLSFELLEQMSGGADVSMLEAARQHTRAQFASSEDNDYCLCKGKCIQKCPCKLAGRMCNAQCHPKSKLCSNACHTT